MGGVTALLAENKDKNITGRVDKVLPLLQVDVCFPRLPSGFPTVSQYLDHTTVVLLPLSRTVLALLTHTALQMDIRSRRCRLTIIRGSGSLQRLIIARNSSQL